MKNEWLITHGHTSGKSWSPEYRTWKNMKSRCYSTCPHSKHYIERGIKVCDRWLNSFENFFNDMGERPSDKHTLDRMDNNKGYNPSNCRWATRSEQCRNQRSNKWVEHNGVKMILGDWATCFGINSSYLYQIVKTRSFEDIYNYYLQKRGRLNLIPPEELRKVKSAKIQ